MATSLEGVDVVWSGPVPSIRHEAAVPLRILLLRGRRLGPFAPSLLPRKMLGGGVGRGSCGARAGRGGRRRGSLCSRGVSRALRDTGLGGHCGQ